MYAQHVKNVPKVGLRIFHPKCNINLAEDSHYKKHWTASKMKTENISLIKNSIIIVMTRKYGLNEKLNINWRLEFKIWKHANSFVVGDYDKPQRHLHVIFIRKLECDRILPNFAARTLWHHFFPDCFPCKLGRIHPGKSRQPPWVFAFRVSCVQTKKEPGFGSKNVFLYYFDCIMYEKLFHHSTSYCILANAIQR